MKFLSVLWNIIKGTPSVMGGWLTAIPTAISLIKTLFDGIKWLAGKIGHAIKSKENKEAVKDAIEKKDTSKLDDFLNNK